MLESYASGECRQHLEVMAGVLSSLKENHRLQEEIENLRSNLEVSKHASVVNVERNPLASSSGNCKVRLVPVTLKYVSEGPYVVCGRSKRIGPTSGQTRERAQ